MTFFDLFSISLRINIHRLPMHTIDNTPILGMPRTTEQDQSFSFAYPDLENPKNYHSKADKPVMTGLQYVAYF